MIESPINEDDVRGHLDTFDELALTAQFMIRLGALLTAHHCEASPEGWRELAVMLAVRYEPTFKDVSRLNQQGSDMPKPSPDAWANARLLKRQIENRAPSQEQAAELLLEWIAAKGRRPYAGRVLGRLLSELHGSRRSVPDWIHGWLRDRAVLKSAMLAAERLSEGCRR